MSKLRWPFYADGFAVSVIRELHDAAAESLLGGAHEGPCDNDDMPDEACQAHVAAAKARDERLAAAVKAMEAEL